MKHRILLLGFALAVSSGLALALGPLGSRAGWWTFRVGFTLLRWSFYLGLAGAATCAVGGVLTRRWKSALLGIVIGVGVAFVPWQQMQSAVGLPPINDISTDLEHAPEFVDILPLRANAPNPPAYGGPTFAEQQRKAYPDIQPLILDVTAASAYERALAVVNELGWEIVASRPEDGRIEAVDTTFWFRFKDDVVIRIREQGSGSRIDVRSKSRVGRGDLGTNARRIREFLGRVRERAGRG